MLGKLLAVVVVLAMGVCVVGEAQEMKINSITFSAPAPLKAGDIITVALAGTPGVRAAFSVKNLIPTTHLKEVSAGSYHGSVRVPKAKFVRNAPLVGYLGNDSGHAAPVQAGRLISVLDPDAPQPPAKLPVIQPESRAQPVDPQASAKKKPVSAPPAPKLAAPPTAEQKPTPPPASVTVANSGKIVLTSPADGAEIRRAITVKGKALPDSTVKVTITYNNNLSGMLKLGGEVASQNLAAGKNGEFRMGPIALDGPLATDGLRFTIKAYYPDRTDHGTAVLGVIGKRE